MPWNEKDTRAYINELQFLQRQINLLQKANATDPEPSIEKTISIMRNSQDKLYNALATRGITAEDAYRIITEDNDKELVKEIINLQKSRESTKTQLSNPNLSPQKRQSLEISLAQKSQTYTDKWNEIINHPNRTALITKIESTQTKTLQKTRTHDKTRDTDRTR
jgi:hypothetical protein